MRRPMRRPTRRTGAEAGAPARIGPGVEGMTGIEPAPSVWKTEALPLSYIPRAQSPVHFHSVVHVDGCRLHVPARGIRTVQ